MTCAAVNNLVEGTLQIAPVFHEAFDPFSKVITVSPETNLRQFVRINDLTR